VHALEEQRHHAVCMVTVCRTAQGQQHAHAIMVIAVLYVTLSVPVVRLHPAPIEEPVSTMVPACASVRFLPILKDPAQEWKLSNELDSMPCEAALWPQHSIVSYKLRRGRGRRMARGAMRRPVCRRCVRDPASAALNAPAPGPCSRVVYTRVGRGRCRGRPLPGQLAATSASAACRARMSYAHKGASDVCVRACALARA
jgi:hypothetical protein